MSPFRLARSGAIGLIGLAFFGVEAVPVSLAVVLLGAALVVGLPHGALDHILASRSPAWRDARGQVAFHGAYLASVAAVLAGWWLVPGPTLLLFLLVAVWHFGETDILHHGAALRRSDVILSRGLLIVFGAIHVSPDAAIHLLEIASGADVEMQLPLARTGGVWVPLCFWAVHARALWLAVGQGPTFASALADATGLVLLIMGAGPLVAFPLYFLVCHTPDHFVALARDGQRTEPWQSVARAALPRTLVSLVGVVGLWLLLDTSQWVTAVLWLVSALTLPHALVVHLLLARGGAAIRQRLGWTAPRETISV